MYVTDVCIYVCCTVAVGFKTNVEYSNASLFYFLYFHFFICSFNNTESIKINPQSFLI